MTDRGENTSGREESPERTVSRPQTGGVFSLTGERLDDAQEHERASRAEMEELFREPPPRHPRAAAGAPDGA
jgi:hypothetical protein